MKEFIIETSARHAHVTKETLEKLFGEGAELEVKKMLSQPGQFASNQRVKVVGPKGELNCSILGPERNADQVEVSLSDARTLGVAAPIRESGDVAGSAPCKLVGPAGEVELTEGVIVAKRHIHMTPADAEEFGVTNGEIVPGASIFGAIVIDSTKEVTVTVNGTATSVNIPANGVVFYCFSVKAAGEFNVVINPAA